MASVGVRELKQNASAVVARARAGESVVVTEHGRPVARLIPYREMTGFERMLLEGSVTLPVHDVRGLPEPVDLGPDNPGSTSLADDRDDPR